MSNQRKHLLGATVAAAVAKRLKSQQQSQHQCQSTGPSSWAAMLQDNFFTHKLFYTSGYSKEQGYQKKASERSRCTYSLIQRIVVMVQSLFRDTGGSSKTVHHVVNTVIADDSDTRMRGAGDKSSIHTVCNTCQSVHVRYSPAGKAECWESVNVPTPMLVLEAAKTGHIHAAMTAFSVVCARGVGELMQNCGLGPSAVGVHSVPFRTEILTGDALRANSAAWKTELYELAKRNAKGSNPTLGMYCKCQVHQLNLIRKPMVLSVAGYWTSLIRLAHLFEQSSFRHAFAAALVQFLQTPNVFQSS